MTPTRILVIGNCTTTSLTAALRIMLPTHSVHGYYRNFFTGDLGVEQAIAECRTTPTVVMVSARLIPEFNERYPDIPVAQAIPTVAYDGLQPDLVHASHAGKPLMNGLRGGYLSQIVLGSFLSGLSEAECAAHFCEDTFQRLGYFDQHAAGLEAHIAAFDACGLDGRWWFDQMAALGNFMYSPNHPIPAGLGLLAYQAAEALSLPIRRDQDFSDTAFWSMYLPDYLRGSVWPVYPAIADRLGITGSYFYQHGDQQAGLTDYIAGCYRNWGPEGFEPGAVTVTPAAALTQFWSVIGFEPPEYIPPVIADTAAAHRDRVVDAPDLLSIPGAEFGFPHLYWEGDVAELSTVLEEWEAHGFTPRVWRFEDLLPLVRERLGERRAELFSRIQIPAGRSFLARTLLLEAYGGCFIDAHVGPPEHHSALTRLAEALRDRDVVICSAAGLHEYDLLFGLILANKGAAPLHDLIERQFAQLEAHYAEQLSDPTVPYNLYVLAGARCVAEAFLVDPSMQEVPAVREELAASVGVHNIQRNGRSRPCTFYRSYTYRRAGQHWSERQSREPLFADTPPEIA